VVTVLKIRYSLPDEETLKNYISEAYDLPFCVLDLYRDQRGALYNACTPQKKYVFKLSNVYYAEKSIHAVNLIDFLLKRKFPVVDIIPTSKGDLYLNIPMPEGIRIGVLYEFIKGKAATYDDIEEVGKTAARLHNEINSYDGIMPRLFDKCLMIDELPKMMRSVRYDEAKIIEIERVSNAIWDRVKHFPSSIVHGDFDMGNIIITDNGVYKLFDFDDAVNMPLIFDIACICNQIKNKSLDKTDVEITEKTIDLFLKGYHFVNPHAEYKTSDILNWIAVRRIDAQMIGLRFLMAKSGNHTAHPVSDIIYKWLMDWEAMFH
jgi:Ser/Thr protein kinase RdoA (MazF antagonist)